MFGTKKTTVRTWRIPSAQFGGTIVYRAKGVKAFVDTRFAKAMTRTPPNTKVAANETDEAAEGRSPRSLRAGDGPNARRDRRRMCQDSGELEPGRATASGGVGVGYRERGQSGLWVAAPDGCIGRTQIGKGPDRPAEVGSHPCFSPIWTDRNNWRNDKDL